MSDDVRILTEALADFFDPDEVKWKPQAVKGNRALAACYVDARVIQDRLDDVLGVVGWQDDYELVPDGSVVCKLSLFIGGEWITKVDVGSPSEQPDGGDRLKAAFSDALKRAAVKFGLGRYLYRLPTQWADYDPQKRQFVTTPQLPAWARPKPQTVDGKSAPAIPAQQPKTPALPAASPSMPANGSELLRRLTDFDTKLAGQGVCVKGDLLQHVIRAAVRAGYSAVVESWTGPAIQLAVESARQFANAPAETKMAGVKSEVRRDNGKLLRQLITEYAARSGVEEGEFVDTLLAVDFEMGAHATLDDLTNEQLLTAVQGLKAKLKPVPAKATA